MKSKLIITLTALLMLGGISAMAQGSFPKGDINEDGVVNAADVVALVNIIMNGEEPSGGTKYYWYAGTTLPTANNIASIALGSSNTIEKWDGKEFNITNSGTESTPAYVCTPVDFKVSWKDMNGFTLNLVEVEGAGFTLNGIDYKVQKRGRDLSAGATITFKGYYTDSDTPRYYWYAGTTIPTAENISTIANDSETSKPDWSEPKSIKATNNTGESAYLYYCFPTEWNIRILDSDKTTEMSLAQEGTFTYGGISYTVQRTGRQISNGSSKDFYATTTSGEAKYYWYAGPDMLTSETVPGINVENECSYGWHVITGNPTSIETGELGTSDCPKINWVLAVPTKFGLTRISNGEDVTDAYEVSTVTTADGVEYKVFTQISQSKKTDRTFVKGSSNEAKYYWYVGNVEPTAASNPATEEGWTALDSKPEQIKIFKEEPNWNDVQWYLAAPAEWGFVTSYNGIVVGGWTKSTITINGVSYNVWTCQALTDTVNVTLANIGN